VLARIPAELAELVKRYAAERGQLSVSELIREGLEWRIGDGDPRGMGMYLAQSAGISEKAYSSNTETAIAQLQVLTQMVEQQTTLLRSNVYSGNTGNAPSAPPASIALRVKSDKAAVMERLQQMHDMGLDSTQIATALQAEGVPTLSGKGQWHAGTVRKLLAK
jgi:hypothetical protein